MFFKLKDLMTTGNIMCGIVSVLISMEGMAADSSEVKTYVFWSGFLILIAFTFDAFDGVVARLLKSSNKFGAEFDNVADLISYSIAPAFLIYLTYKRYSFISTWDPVLCSIISAILASFPPVFGALRFARFNVKKIEYPGFWIGLPRPASALMILSFLNSHLFEISRTFQAIGMALIVLLSFMNISLIPYIGHHRRKFSWYLSIVLPWVAISVFLSVIGGIFLDLLPRKFAFDMIFIWLFFYIFIEYIDIPKETIDDIKKFREEWKKEV